MSAVIVFSSKKNGPITFVTQKSVPHINLWAVTFNFPSNM